MQKLCPDFRQKNFLLAVSGGADSMVLLHLFQVSGLKFQVAHVNYKLRGEDSEKDQKFVKEFCRKHHIPFHLYEISEKDEKPENSIQNWARNLRYRFFKEIQEQENIEILVTAHHLNDQLETFIINLSRGSGIRGLSGIPADENGIIRPLLEFSKEEIYHFAKENQIEFREDSSNKKNDYLRNFIRNTIVPELEKTNENFLQNFASSIEYLNQAKSFVDDKINEIQDTIISKKDETIIINKKRLNTESDFVKFEILRKFGFNNSNEIAKIFSTETGKSFYSDDFQLVVDREELILVRKSEDGNEETDEKIVLEIKAGNIIDLSDFIEEDCFMARNDKWRFDAEKLVFPLKLRRKKQGDVFFPAGMTGKKTVSKFFKDEKISIFDKTKIWLLADGNDVVLGVLPLRQDRRFSADDTAKNIVNIQFKSKK
ncbi:MAG: tRNA lysidine(34) synthetase TilS [Bergeyella sp.]